MTVLLVHFVVVLADVYSPHSDTQPRERAGVFHPSLGGKPAGREGVKQRTLLNLGSQLGLNQAEWPALAARIEQLLHGQGSLLASTLSETAETLAQRYAAQLLARQPDELMLVSKAGAPGAGAARFTEVDLATLEQVRPRNRTMPARCKPFAKAFA